MRIAQISPLIESVPPKTYGGTERVVSNLTDELVKKGHDVTLFASGDSETSAHLVPCLPEAIRLSTTDIDPLPHHLLMVERVRECAGDFDVLHFHTDFLQYLAFEGSDLPILTTMHGRLDLSDSHALYRRYSQTPLVSISMNQRNPMPPVNWVGNVYHGLKTDTLAPVSNPANDYLAFLGRICPDKGPERAIEISRQTGIPLRIAAKVDNVDKEYFEAIVLPLLDSGHVEFIGEITESEKSDFLGNARALLFPIDWPEPFGLTMIESMACGTPVIAWHCGSVPEVIDQGVTGYIVRSVDEATDAVRMVHWLDREEVRAVFEEKYSADRMAEQYLAIYKNLKGNCDETLDRPRAVA